MRRGLGHIGRTIHVICYNPRYAFVGALVVLAWLTNAFFALWAPMVVLGLAVIALGAWIAFRPKSFWESWRGLLRAGIYRISWCRTMRRCDVAKLDVPLPLLLTTHATHYVDKLKIWIPIGLDPWSFQEHRAELLKWGWKGQSARVYDPQPRHHTIELWNLILDPLIEDVVPFPQSTALPKQGLPLAVQEDGEPWYLKIQGGAAHTFVCGISGAGKGSFFAALFDQLQQGIADKTVELRGVDPQASEFGMSRHLFAKLVFTRQEAAVMLEDLVAIMDKRTRTMFGVTRQHLPTPGDPFYVVPIDEGLDLLDKTDRVLYKRIDNALRQLLRKGRKASIMVVFVSQRAELATVEIRKDFPIGVAFQLKTEADVDMILGRGALSAGARAHEISTPGVAYVATERGIVRVRFPHFTDEYLRELPPAPGNENPDNLPTVGGPGPDIGGVLIA
jgi:S-DNA-T family DNA segregation ATPase FtsK/SpoIIIE